MLKRIFKEWYGETWTGLIWLRIRTGKGTYESGNKCSGSITCGKFIA
jgi:hypothetical protein